MKVYVLIYKEYADFELLQMQARYRSPRPRNV